MPVVNHFYNATTKKYIALFGTMFNKISIVRYDATSGEEVQRMIVPISYGPYQKFLARVNQDPELNRKTAITLPRMSFEITNMQYDGTRKLNSVKRIGGKLSNNNESKAFQYVGAPYNLDFALNIMTKYAEDGTPDALAYSNMVSLCIKAIQEQQATITALEARITALENA